jgi:hypothetical protein
MIGGVQIVGQPCEHCEKPIKSELDGTGCIHCERFFHDACVLAPPPERADTYRVSAATERAPQPKRKKKVRCPGCGADTRKEQRERDRITTQQREVLEEERRVAAANRAGGNANAWMLFRLGLVFAWLVVSFVLGMCGR